MNYPKLSAESLLALHRTGVPDHMHLGIIRYVDEGVLPGRFLRAVIDNDLRAACLFADDINKHYLYNFVVWFHNHAPSRCWGFAGAAEKHADWLIARDDAA